MTRQASSVRIAAITLLSAASLIGNSSAGSATPSAPATCGPDWSLVQSPNGRGGSSGLGAVSAVSPNDVWAVGSHAIDRFHPAKTLAEHWDGNSWSIVPTPSRNSSSNFLGAVDALSTSDAWAAGQSIKGSVRRTLIERWDGSSWSIVPSPNRGANNLLWGVAALSDADAWTVGDYYRDDSVQRTLIEHWDGSAWSVVRSPSPGAENNELTAVAALSASDIWAVGDFGPNSQGYSRPLIEHWDGTKWRLVSAPHTPSAITYLYSVTAIATNDVWAVGASGTQPFAEHWDGGTWKETPAIPVGNDVSRFVGVSAISANDVLAVGRYRPRGPNTEAALVERWDGNSWAVMSTQDATKEDSLRNISALPSGYAWAVGSALPPKTGRYTTLVEALCP